MKDFIQKNIYLSLLFVCLISLAIGLFSGFVADRVLLNIRSRLLGTQGKMMVAPYTMPMYRGRGYRYYYQVPQNPNQTIPTPSVTPTPSVQ